MMTAEHDKCNTTQVGMPKKCNYKPHADKHAHRSFPSVSTWPQLQALPHIDKPQTHTHRRLRRPRAAPTPAAAPRCAGRDSRASLATLALPPACHCASARDSRSPRSPPAREAAVPGAGGRARWGGRAAGPGLGDRGGDEGRARGGARLTWAGGSS